MKIFVSLILGLLISFGAYAQSSASDTFTSSMVLRDGITLECGNMVFPGAVAHQAYSAGIKSSDNELYSGFGGGQNASCAVTGYGATNVRYSITLPSGSVDMLVGGTGDPITIDSFALASGNLTGRDLSTGSDNFEIVGELDAIPDSLPAGSYSASGISVSVSYDGP